MQESNMRNFPVILPKSSNIQIPINNSRENLFKLADDEAYMVTSQIFDPRDSSPPNEWNIRLKNRLAKFNNNSNNSNTSTLE